MRKRKIFAAIDVPCPACGAKPDERCKQDLYPLSRQHHAERVWDANDAQVAIEALTQ